MHGGWLPIITRSDRLLKIKIDHLFLGLTFLTVYIRKTLPFNKYTQFFYQ
jgi:hypothetical protein